VRVNAQPQAQSTTSTLRTLGNSIEYLVIAPRAFVPEIESYVRWRGTTTATHRGLRTFIATLEDINQEFLDRRKPQAQAEAIRDFISSLMQPITNPNFYVVLMGSTNIIPAYRAKVTEFEFTQPPYINNEDSIPMDNWYIVNRFIEEFNTRPQARIGRIPGRTPPEIRRVLQKIRTFEETGNWARYNFTNRFTSIIDAQDAEMFSEWQFSVMNFLEATTKQTITSATLSYRSIANTFGAKDIAMRAINGGSPCLLYFGHGAPEKWSTFAIVTTDDVWNRFARDGRPFMFASLGCSQNYGIPNRLSIVESMMLLDNGGAVMSLASSGYSNGQVGRFFLATYFGQLFNTPGIDVGTAILRTNEQSYGNLARIPQDDLNRRFALLGDPALVPFPRILTSVREQQQATNGETMPFTLAPNPVSEGETTLQYTLPAASRVRVEVLTLLGQVVYSYEEQQAQGAQMLGIPTENLAAGAYICRIRAGNQTSARTLRVVR
jgi:hypothetical protein